MTRDLARRWIQPVGLLCTVTALAACDVGFSLKPLGEKLDPRPGSRISQTAPRPSADSRGVIVYPNYQVIVAKRGDSLQDVAARVGLSGEQLRIYNGLPKNYRPRAGEVLALPAGAAQQTSGSIEEIASSAIDDAPQTPVETGIPQSGPEPIRHVVEQGETAYSIARLYGVSVTALASWNGLDRDLSVRVGQKLLVPVVADGTPRSASNSAPGAGSVAPLPPSSTQPLPDPVEVADLPESPNLGAERTPPGASRKLLKPVSGDIIRGYSSAAGGNEGIDIAAPSGASVKAAENGEIALVSDSVGQGTIVLLRHPDNLYTVYSNVTGVSMRKGQTVSRGQVIGKVGSGNPSFLHFEIRRGTESVDPIPYL